MKILLIIILFLSYFKLSSFEGLDTIWSSEEINPYQIFTFIDNDNKFVAYNEKKDGISVYDTYTAEELKFFPKPENGVIQAFQMNNRNYFFLSSAVIVNDEPRENYKLIQIVDNLTLEVTDTLHHPSDFPKNSSGFYISSSHDGSKIVALSTYRTGSFPDEQSTKIGLVYDMESKQLLSYTNYLDTREVYYRPLYHKRIIWNKDNIHYYCASQNNENEFLKVNSLTGEIVKRLDDGSEVTSYYISDQNNYYVLITEKFTYIYDMFDNLIQKHKITLEHYPNANAVDYLNINEDKDLIFFRTYKYETTDANEKEHRLFYLKSGEFITPFWEYYNLVTEDQSNFLYITSNKNNSLHIIYNYVDKPKTYLVRNFWDMPVINSVNETPDILKEFDNKIILYNSENKINLIELYNITGQKILDIPTQNNEIKIDKTILPHGLYLLRYNYNNHSYTYKFIKE